MYVMPWDEPSEAVATAGVSEERGKEEGQHGHDRRVWGWGRNEQSQQDDDQGRVGKDGRAGPEVNDAGAGHCTKSTTGEWAWLCLNQSQRGHRSWLLVRGSSSP